MNYSQLWYRRLGTLIRPRHGNSILKDLRLHSSPRYEKGYTSLLGRDIAYLDAASFLASRKEIFTDEQYQFVSKTDPAIIIDCGANIGLSTIYFKTLYPDSIVHAFEADPHIFKVLEENIDRFELEGVHLHHAAVWTHDQGIHFESEGGTAGHISSDDDLKNTNSYFVPSISLREFLTQFDKVEMLKMDIEGAEVSVLMDTKDQLAKATHIFVEYHSFTNEEQTLPHILTTLRDLEFRYHIKEAFSRSIPFVSKEEQQGMDLQLNIFAQK